MARPASGRKKRYITYFTPRVGYSRAERKKIVQKYSAIAGLIVKKYGMEKFRRIMELHTLMVIQGQRFEEIPAMVAKSLRVRRSYVERFFAIEEELAFPAGYEKVRVEAKCEYCGAYARDICYMCEAVVCGKHIYEVEPFAPMNEDEKEVLRDSDELENWVTCVECAED